MEKLIQLITKLYGKSALSKTLGTRTNVITLSDNETKRFIKEELNIEAASDAAAQAAKDKAENLIADIPKMNDQEILTFTGNLQRLDNKLNPPSAEVVQMGSKEVVPAEGIEQLAAGQTAKRLMDETISMAEKRQRSANEGLIRTAVRFKMIKDLREGKLKVPEEIAQSISQVGSSRNDPIKLFEKYYGPDALEIVDELSPEFRMIERRGGTEMDLVTKIEQNVDARPLTPQEISDMAANTREAGRVRQEVEEGNIIPLTGKDPEEFATGGRVGLKNGSEDVITITDKIDELISFYQDYLKQGGKMNFITFAKKYIPENFATGGRVGFDDGGLGSLPTGLQMDTTTSNSIPENAPNMAADEIAKVIMGTGFLPEEDDELGYPEGMEKPMSSKLFIFEQYVIPQRKKMMENFGLTLKEADDLIRQEMEKYRTNKATGGRVGFANAGSVMKDPDDVVAGMDNELNPGTLDKILGIFTGKYGGADEGAALIEQIQDYKYGESYPNETIGVMEEGIFNVIPKPDRPPMSMEETIKALEDRWDMAIEEGYEPGKGGEFDDLGIYSKEDIRRRVELGYDSAKASETQTGIMKAANGGRVGFQIGGPAYDATDPIYGSSAITVTPDTIMGPQGNQIQAQSGVNQALQRPQNFLEMFKDHAVVSQAMKGKSSMGPIDQYGMQTGYDFQEKSKMNPIASSILASGYQLATEGLGMFNPKNPNFLNPVQAFKTAQSDATKNIEGILASQSRNLTQQQQDDRNKYLANQGQAQEPFLNPTSITNIETKTKTLTPFEKYKAKMLEGFRKNYAGQKTVTTDLQLDGTYSGTPKEIPIEDYFTALIAQMDRDPAAYGYASGGRVGYAYGSGKKLLDVLKQKGKDITQEIKKAVDNIYTTDDIKYDADVAVDDMLETLGIDRSEIDEKDILDAYGMAYDELKKPLLEKLRNKPVENLAPKMTERFELKEKYPGIDDDLLTAIIDDPDPNNKAQVLATLEQLMELQRQGKTPEEAADIIKQTMFKGRRDNSQGGLNYLSGF